MVARTALSVLFALGLASAGRAIAAPYVTAVSINAGPLRSSLQSLQRQTGIELLFDSTLVDGLQSPAVQGDFSPEGALRELLVDTDLSMRRADSGAWIVEPAAAPPLAKPDVPVAEILVVGRRTQNADLRRFELDVQPYTVASKLELRASHRDNLDQYFRSRVTEDTIAVPPELAQTADTRSAIDLRGLGPQNTLVLIDGRRMPSVALPSILRPPIGQTDVNAIPLDAIARVETLTGTAGGIYGFGALGGVVNVVLDRESRGLELHFIQGVSWRGDARRQGMNVGFGRSWQQGTTFTVFAAHTESDPLLVGERSYAARDRQLTADYAPQYFRYAFPSANSVSVSSLSGGNLVLRPELGGAALSSDHTFVPIGGSTDAASLAAALTQHAGEIDTSVPSFDATSELEASRQTDSLLANVRHRFGTAFEAYLDAVLLRNDGETNVRTSGGQGLASPNSPANPFTDDIVFGFPTPQTDTHTANRFETTRYTAGFLVELPGDWRGTVELGSGAFRFTHSESTTDDSGEVLYLLGDPTDLDRNPFGDWNAFQRAVARGSSSRSLTFDSETRFRDRSLRFAGPVFSTASGPATLTVLAERLTERAPESTEYQGQEQSGTTTVTPTVYAANSRATHSLYAELRSRFLESSDAARFPSGLELQLAVRRDEQDNEFTNDLRADSEPVHASFAGTTYTAGVKVFPAHWLLLRASYATGEQPPPITLLSGESEQTMSFAVATDPQRDGTDLGVDGAYSFEFGGNPELGTVRASTGSVGVVLVPKGTDGPRFAIDYSVIHRTRDVRLFSPQDILAHEDFWPDRVTRAPLTDEDRAKGYTAGRILVLDARAMNAAESEVEAWDLHAEWPLAWLGGRLRPYVNATHQVRNTTIVPFAPPAVNHVGYLNGPLKRRANAGVDWSTERLMIGANLQYFGSSQIVQPNMPPAAIAQVVQIQGSTEIPSQTYLDLNLVWRPRIRASSPLSELTLEAGLVNALDKEPPRVSSALIVEPASAYSLYGDPRQRRYSLVLSARF